MTFIGKELREISRDGRVVAAAIIVLCLTLVALAVGAERAAEEGRQRQAASAADERLWSNQGERNPHIAAHFGKYALRPMPALAFFDPGVTRHAGSAIWIEAHYQNPFAFRPSQDATSLLRFGELAPSMLLQWLVPLLIIVVGFPMFAAERERGTLRQVMSAGADPRRLVRAKAGALTIVVALLLGAAMVLAGIVAASSLPHPTADDWLRAAGLVIAYGVYLGIFIAITIAVSARAATARAAVTALLAFWICSVLVVPRLAAELALRAHPLPTSSDFWAAIRHDIDRGMDGHNPRDARRQALEAKLLRQYRVTKVADLPINFEGLALEEGERYANQVFDRHYGRLYEIYRQRDRFQQRFAIASPLLAIRGISMALAGTDNAHQADFAVAAESYRRELQYFLNHDMTVNALNVEFLDYKRGRALWDAAPKFAHQAPPVMRSIAPQRIALWLLVAWGVAAILLLMRTGRAIGGEGMKRLILELRLAMDRSAIVVAALFLVAAAVALWNGVQWRDERMAAVEAERLRGVEELATVRSELAAIDNGTLAFANASLPTRFLGRFNHRALLPASPLSAAAIGRADQQPFAAQISLHAVRHSLLDKQQIEDPLALFAGRFDLAFVMIYLLPLAILAFTYDLVSSERERGSLVLAVPQAGSLGRLLRAKLAVRALLLLLLIAIPATALFFLAPAMEVFLWMMVVAAYAIFWIALAVAVNLLGRASAANATILAGAWLLLLVIVPAAMNVWVARRHPLPSRLDVLARIRAVNLSTAESGQKLLDQFLQEHPDLAVDSTSGAGQYYAIRQSQERNILPLTLALETQLARQQSVIARYRIFSPAIVADELLLEIAGTGRTRFGRYETQLGEFLDRWRAHFVTRAFRGGLVTRAELDAMPQFSFVEEARNAMTRRTTRGIAMLLAPALLLIAWSGWRLRTFRGI